MATKETATAKSVQGLCSFFFYLNITGLSMTALFWKEMWAAVHFILKLQKWKPLAYGHGRTNDVYNILSCMLKNIMRMCECCGLAHELTEETERCTGEQN